MPRISKSKPRGYVYILEAERAAGQERAYTKIGSSSIGFRASKGRAAIAEFWMKALGLGGIHHKEIFHRRAYFVERSVHDYLKQKELINTEGNSECGKSTESFNIAFDDAVALVKAKASEVDDA